MVIEQANKYIEHIHWAVAKMDQVLQELSLTIYWGQSTTSHKIKLPRYSSFWDSFNSPAHSNPKLSEKENFNYLHSLTEGSSHEAIAGPMLLYINYKEALENLKKPFGNKQVMSKHKEPLLEVETVESDKVFMA